MEVTTIKCDICGKLETVEDYGSPEGWYYLGRQADKTKDLDYWAKRRDICDECAKRFNLPNICNTIDIERKDFLTTNKK